MEVAPPVASITASHGSAEVAPDSTPTTLPPLVSGTETFDDIEHVLRRVRELHEVYDEDVTPHKSKYAARIIMTDILALLRPLLSSSSLSSSEVQWVTEQIGRVEYLNGVNHIEAEETSAGEKMLVKAMVKFKDNSVRYPFDVMDGYNHLGVVWSNRTQHAAAHAYLQQAQQAFLRFKKLRQAALDQLTDEERQYVAAEDKKQQEEVVVVEEETTTAATVTDVSVEKKDDAETKSADDDKESASAAAAAAASSTAFAVAPRTLSLSPSAPGFRFLDSVFWHRLEVTHTLTLFFLAQVFGHMKKRDLAAIYCHLCLNRQLKQRQDFQRTEWVTNAIGLSFYYSGRKLFQQAHHCLLAAQSFIDEKDMPKKMNTPTADTSRDQQLAADLCRAWGAFYLKWLQRSRDLFIEHELSPATANADSSTSGGETVAPTKDDLGPVDPSTSLASLPANELAELKRLQRLDRDRERHFENAVEEEADEDEDELFGDLTKARPAKTKEESDAKKNPVDRTLPSTLTPEEQEAVTEELKKNKEEEAQEAAQTTSAVAAASQNEAVTTNTGAAAGVSSSPASASAPISSAHLFIEFKSLHLPVSPICVPATNFIAARVLFKSSLEWFTRASLFYVLDGYVSDHIPIQQDISLLYKLLAVFDVDLSRQCKMHKRRIDLLTPIYKQLSLASYQEFFQQLTDELASTYADMMELKQFILHMKVRILGPKVFSEKKRDDAQQKVNELALNAIQFYQIWLQSWSKDGKEVETLDEYYHRWYLMAMFKIARCYSKIYHSEPQVLNQFIKKSLDQYKAVVSKALAWKAVHVMPQELELCSEMIQLLPHKMDRVVAKGGFRV